jgi:hypothetical protein
MLPNNIAASDGGFQNGFYINYSQNPAHLVLSGTYCTDYMAGTSRLDMIEGCNIPQ